MIDECRYCDLKGDLNKCLTVSCSQHETWYAKELTRRLEELKTVVHRCNNVKNILYLNVTDENTNMQVKAAYDSAAKLLDVALSSLEPDWHDYSGNGCNATAILKEEEEEEEDVKDPINDQK